MEIVLENNTNEKSGFKENKNRQMEINMRCYVDGMQQDQQHHVYTGKGTLHKIFSALSINKANNKLSFWIAFSIFKHARFPLFHSSYSQFLLDFSFKLTQHEIHKLF